MKEKVDWPTLLLLVLCCLSFMIVVACMMAMQ